MGGLSDGFQSEVSADSANQSGRSIGTSRH